MDSRFFHKLIRKAGCVFLGAVLLLFAFLPAAGAETTTPDLDALITAAFTARRAHVTAGDSLLADLDSYDYPQQLEILGKTVSRYSGYAEEMADAHPDFLLDRLGREGKLKGVFV